MFHNLTSIEIETLKNTKVIYQIKHKVKKKEIIDGIGGKMSFVTNIINFFSTKDDYELYKNAYHPLDSLIISGVLGPPVCTISEFESNPGVWIFIDFEYNITYLVYTDTHRKNAYKGISIDIIYNPSSIKNIKKSFSKFIEFIQQYNKKENK